MKPNNSKHFAIAFRCGRLANRLVLFANFIAFAEEYGYRVSNVTFHTYADQFSTTRQDIYCRYPVMKRKSILDTIPYLAKTIRKTRVLTHVIRAVSILNENCTHLGERFITLHEQQGADITYLESSDIQAKIAKAETIFVYGWRFRAPACVQRHAEAIRQYFKPVAKVELASQNAISPLRENADIVIGVHIRRGDYKSWHNGQYYFSVDNYVKWMHELAEQLHEKKVAFMVSSDEKWTREDFPGLTVGFGPGFPIGDIYALAKSDYIIGPLSTFSQWASFYGNKPLFHLRERDVHIELKNFSVADLLEIP